MPRPTRRPGPPSIYIGVWGAGDTTTENITALLDDFIEGLGEVTPRFVVPLEKELTTEPILDVANYALEKNYDLQVVFEKKPTTKVLKELLVAASKEHVAEEADADAVDFTPTGDAIADTLVAVLGDKPEDARLLFLWPADDASDQTVEDDERVLFAGVDSNIVVLDLTQGLDRLGADGDEDDAAPEEPEEEKPAPAKKAAAKKTAAAKPDPEEEPEEPADGTDLEPIETVIPWPIRRMRSYAKEIAAADREEGIADTPTDDELDEFNKEAILDYLYPDREKAADPEPEPEEEPKDETITPRRARQMREASEADGTDSTTKNRAKAAAAKKAAAAPEEPEAEPEAAAEPESTVDDGEGHLEALVEAVNDLLEEFNRDPYDDEAFSAALVDAADAFADHIIYRIAKRVEREPEKAPYRTAIAPPRAPGKPRKDGEAPRRRASRRS